MESRQTPVILTRQELATFNRFYASLTESDRQLLSELLEADRLSHPSTDPAGYPIPYLARLLALLVEEHKLVLRLQQQLRLQRGAPSA
jgi:hypothetical protein